MKNLITNIIYIYYMMKNTNKKNIFLGLLSLGIGLYSLYESNQNKKEINGIKKKSNIEGLYISNFGEQLIMTDKDFLISNNNSNEPYTTHYKIVKHNESDKILYLATDRSDEFTGGKYNSLIYFFGETIIENEKIEYFAYYIIEYGINNLTEFKNTYPQSKDKYTYCVKHNMKNIKNTDYQEIIEKADKIKKLLC